MAFGLSVLNDSGFQQISEDSSNLFMLAAGSQYASPTGVARSILPPAGYSDSYLTLVRSDSYGVGIFGNANYIFATSTIVVEVLLVGFKDDPNIIDTYGLRSYKHDGILSFDASKKLPKLQSRTVLTATQIADITTPYYISIPQTLIGSRKRYMSLNSTGIDRIVPTSPGLPGRYQGRSISLNATNSTLTISALFSYSNSFPTSVAYLMYRPRQYFIMDY
jgi:hypothetical protein